MPEKLCRNHFFVDASLEVQTSVKGLDSSDCRRSRPCRQVTVSSLQQSFGCTSPGRSDGRFHRKSRHRPYAASQRHRERLLPRFPTGTLDPKRLLPRPRDRSLTGDDHPTTFSRSLHSPVLPLRLPASRVTPLLMAECAYMSCPGGRAGPARGSLRPPIRIFAGAIAL